MLLNIDDSLSGRERRDQVIIQQVHYAMDKFPSKRYAAEFLGVTERGLRNWCHKYDELKIYIDYNSFLKGKTEEAKDRYLEMLKRYPS